MGAAIMFFGPALTLGPVIGSLIASGCNWIDLNPSIVYISFIIGFGSAVAMLYSLPANPVGEHEWTKSLGKYLISSITAVALLSAMIVYTIGFTFTSFETFMEFWKITFSLISNWLFQEE